MPQGKHSDMTGIFADIGLLPDGWASDVRIVADAAGTIVTVTPGSKPGTADIRLAGVIIPGVPNLHSHAFQRGMAGHGERRSPAGQDSFWTWREAMYRHALTVSPGQAEAIAAQLYVECLEWGFTSIAEFHYLHHQPDGRPYADPAEMGLRMMAAARRAGIGMTMLPSLYAFGGIFGKAPHAGQRRFLNDLDGFFAILDRLVAEAERDAQFAIGVAPHSLRAVSPEMLSALFAMRTPIHMHAAEQMQEVADCIAATGARPVEWLLRNAPLDARWCLIHCTHMTMEETRALAATGAVVGLCPSTEASLGDGTFALPAYRNAAGLFGIGTDSHVGTSPRDELRALETSQRLALQQRSIATDDDNPHPGRVLLDAAWAGGAQASGRALGRIAPGARCDLVELDAGHPGLVGQAGDALLDAWIFSGQGNPVRSVFVGGRCVVRDGRHIDREAIGAGFSRAMKELA